MPVPTHREDCQTRTWRTYCLDCHKPVWFFSCTCGSKVFFDTKGPPWRLHADSCPIYHVRTLIDAGSDPKQIRKLLESEAHLRNVPIPTEVAEYLSKFTSPGKIHYQDILPSDEPCEIAGKVLQINQINIIKRFNLDDNLIIRKTLGDLASQSFFEIVIHESQAKNNNTIKRWTFIIPVSEVEGYGLHVGMSATASIEGRTVMDDDAVWLATSLDWK